MRAGFRSGAEGQACGPDVLRPRPPVIATLTGAVTKKPACDHRFGELGSPESRERRPPSSPKASPSSQSVSLPPGRHTEVVVRETPVRRARRIKGRGGIGPRAVSPAWLDQPLRLPNNAA